MPWQEASHDRSGFSINLCPPFFCLQNEPLHPTLPLVTQPCILFSVSSTLPASVQRLFSCTSPSRAPETAPSPLTHTVLARNLGSVGGLRLVLNVQLSREGKAMPVTMQWGPVPRRGSLCGSDHRHHMAMAWSRPMSAEPPVFGPRSPSDLCPSSPPILYCPQILGKSSYCPSTFSSMPWGGFFKFRHLILSDPRLFPGLSTVSPFFSQSRCPTLSQV